MTADVSKSSDLRLVIHFDIEEPIGLNIKVRGFGDGY